MSEISSRSRFSWETRNSKFSREVKREIFFLLFYAAGSYWEKRERERERQTDRQRQRMRDRQRERMKETEKERQTKRENDRERENEWEGGT